MKKFPGAPRRWASLLLVATGIFHATPSLAAPQTLQNDVFWKDTAGNPIYSQGGGILKVDDRYYWYGVKYQGAVSYIKTLKKANSSRFSAVTAYSSTDLVNWKFEGNVVEANASVFASAGWLGRLGVVYHQASGKYVLITQYSGKGSGAGVLFATSDKPTGPFVFDNLQPAIDNVVSPATGDQTVFVDDDGQPYLIFSNSKGRSHLYVAPLRADYLHVEPATEIYQSAAGGREGNAMFKYQGRYYFCSSALHGWNASRSYYMTAKNITGPYSAEAVIPGTEADFSHVTQTGFFIPVHGSAGSLVLFAGDRWSDFAGNGIGYNQWMPMSFNGATPLFHSLSQFNLDAAQGTWTVGKGNNYVLNPGFEADRVVQTSLTGWVTSWTNLATTSPPNNKLDGRSGRWALTLNHAEPTIGSTYQQIALPDGSYTLKAWAKSSGGQSEAKLYVQGHGGAEMAQALNTVIRQWTEITIPHIAVSNGSVEVGVHSEGKDGQWLDVDDVSLVRE